MSIKSKTAKGAGILLAVVVLLFVFAGSQILETVRVGDYVIKQEAVVGTISAHMKPGVMWQSFGDVKAWPKARTFYFTSDSDEGANMDESIEVRFNEGSLCNVSGSCRIILPTEKAQAIALVKTYNFKDYDEFANELVRKVIRNALRLTANLMSARESYSEKRAEFLNLAWDQVQNGMYETYEEKAEVIDDLGQKVEKMVKKIKMGPDGKPLYQSSPLAGLGVKLANFDIKIFKYSDKVQEQIKTQQNAYMAVVTARANALLANQKEKTRKEEGKAAVVTAQYVKEIDKAVAIVKMEKDRSIAVINKEADTAVETLDAEKDKIAAEMAHEVAAIDRQTAEQIKLANVLMGEGEAEKKRLIITADGALKEKLGAFESANASWAKAFSMREVPRLQMGQKETADNETILFSTNLQEAVAKMLKLELNVFGAADAKLQKLAAAKPQKVVAAGADK
jgi:hypothetical protein